MCPCVRGFISGSCARVTNDPAITIILLLLYHYDGYNNIALGQLRKGYDDLARRIDAVRQAHNRQVRC